MNSDVYILKCYKGNSIYSEFSESLVEKNIGQLQIMDSIFDEVTTDQSKKLMMPLAYYKNLCDLLNHFNLNKYESDFLFLIAQIQSVYLLYNESVEDKLFEDFNNEKKDLENLLNILDKYLMNPKKELHSISFKFKTGTANTIKNHFVVNDIYKAVQEYYNINKENFHLRKEEILQNMVNTFNYKKGRSYVIISTVKYFVHFLQDISSEISDNQALKFSGCLLHICQIPTKSNQYEILIYDDINSNLESIEYQNLRHYLNDRSNTSL